MDPIRNIKLRWVHGALRDITNDLSHSQFSRFAHAWRPAINAYRCKSCIRICVDLAGIDRADINLTIQDQHLSIRGVRDVPEPEDEKKHAMQMIAMEIDYGLFEREVALPEDVDPQKVHAEQKNGFLWIHLPLKKS